MNTSAPACRLECPADHSVWRNPELQRHRSHGRKPKSVQGSRHGQQPQPHRDYRSLSPGNRTGRKLDWLRGRNCHETVSFGTGKRRRKSSISGETQAGFTFLTQEFGRIFLGSAQKNRAIRSNLFGAACGSPKSISASIPCAAANSSRHRAIDITQVSSYHKPVPPMFEKMAG